MSNKLADYIKLKGENEKLKELIKSELSTEIHDYDESDTIRVDFHNMTLLEVKNWLFYEMNGYCKAGFKKFDCIHGFNHGTIIRDYIRGKFKQEFQNKNKDITLTIIPLENGRTQVIING